MPFKSVVIGIGNSLLSETTSDLQDFFQNLFARQRFTSHLLERSYYQLSSWVEVAIVIILVISLLYLSKYFQRKVLINTDSKWNALRHIGYRLMSPLLILISATIVLYVWRLFGFQAVWIRFLIMAAGWMVLIRLALGIVHSALPLSKTADTLERFLSAGLWVFFVLWLSGIDDFIIQILKSIQLPLGSSSLSLFTLLSGLIWVAITVLLAMWLANVINDQLMKRERIDLNLRIVLSKVTKFLLLILSLFIALPLVGIDLTVLSVFGGALGVGVGLGLQKVASNYIAGFIILSDRSIRPGDRLTVKNFTGYVTKITSRFVVLQGSSGSEALIPNETFINSTVINESYTGKILQNNLAVQVAYHTDITVALNILKDVATAQERVGKDPAPVAFLTNFGENGIDLQLSYWVLDPENGFRGLSSAILLDIWKRFNEHKIEFPFPQREVRILQEAAVPSDQAIIRAGIEAQTNTASIEEHPSPNDPKTP